MYNLSTMVDIEKIIREYITKTVHMSLATVKDNRPWVCEVHFAYDENLNLYFISNPSTRHGQEIAENPNVAGNIVRQHEKSDLPHGIYFEGSAEIIEASAEDVERYCRYLERDKAVVEEWLSSEGKNKMYKVIVSNWFAFGKFEEALHKYELEWNGSSK